MKTDKMNDFLEFKDLVFYRANNLLYCFDGSITALRNKSTIEFFFKQTYSEVYNTKHFVTSFDLDHFNYQVQN